MNSKIKKTVKNIFNKFYWKQHPEAALRYSPIVSKLKQLHLEDSKILEIGSGSLGIIPYLKRPIDGLDIDFSGPQTKLLCKIKGSAVNMPFRKNAYDVVISADTLEHIEPENREQSIYEMLRVAKKMVSIVVPVGKLSEKQDLITNTRWQRVFGNNYQFLDEHIKYGLPKTEEVLVFLDKSLRKLNKKAKVASFPSLNLVVRNILMSVWISKNKLVYYAYLKGFLLLLPALRLCNFGNCYRRVFMIEFDNPTNVHLELSMKNSENAKDKSLKTTIK